MLLPHPPPVRVCAGLSFFCRFVICSCRASAQCERCESTHPPAAAVQLSCFVDHVTSRPQATGLARHTTPGMTRSRKARRLFVAIRAVVDPFHPHFRFGFSNKAIC